MRRTGGELARLRPREVAQVSRRLSEHSKKAERNQDINRFRNGPEAPRLPAGGAMVRNRILIVAALVVPFTLPVVKGAPAVAQPTLTATPGAALPRATGTVRCRSPPGAAGQLTRAVGSGAASPGATAPKPAPSRAPTPHAAPTTTRAKTPVPRSARTAVPPTGPTSVPTAYPTTEPTNVPTTT